MIIKNKLEKLLLAHWADVLDRQRFMAAVLEHARDSQYPVIEQEPPRNHIQLSVTKFETIKDGFELWAEFSAPKENGVVIGTHIFSLSLSGELLLKDTYGTLFKPPS